jgi:ABC-2 type transport system ATP-binding protein
LAAQLREAFELDPRQKIKTLSRGQRARVGLLAALAHRPELLLLDEPSSGLDPVVRRDILGAIVRTVADEGRTVLFSSHLLDEVQRVADHVAMLHEGRLVLSQPLESVLAAHHRVILHFAEPQPSDLRLPGALSCSGEGREWTCVCNGELEQLKQAAAARGGQIVEEATASLDEVFVSRVKGQA